MSRGAIYVEGSKNSKLSGTQPIDGTYTSIKDTCSPTCPLKKDKLCYATLSYVGMINKRMERRARGGSPLDLARAEARAIAQSYGGGAVPAGRNLRLHISGDCRVRAGVRLINAAVGRWKKRGGGDCFSYTHSHARVPRSLWSNVSMLASIESTSQVAAVRQMGYVPAIVVSEHTTDKAHRLEGSDTIFIPCPAQTKDNVGCSDCKLCMKSEWLYRTNRGISFAAHGIRKTELKRHLKMV
jgi:hypothetical protein